MKELSPTFSRRSDWLVWQLVDSAFPTGGFAHSGGLEAAWQHQEVRHRADVEAYIDASLEQAGRGALPLVLAAHRSPEQLVELDGLCDAFTSNHVANRASRAQGRALHAAAQRIFAVPGLPASARHFAPMFGAVTRLLEINADTAAEAFFFGHLRSLTASAVRLNMVGPMEAQRLQHQFSARAQEILAACRYLGVEDLAQTAPLLELWQGAQDRLYSRLFQS